MSCNITPVKIPGSPFMEKLGFGTGVTIFRMNRVHKLMNTNSPWAVKQTNKNHKERPEIGERLRDEAVILRTLNHINIVGFRAYAHLDDGRDCLAMEVCSNSLGDLIEERAETNPTAFSVNRIIKMIVDVVNGLDYLHHTVKILHGDIKSYNVLVKNDFEICKLCDFGVSLPLTDDGGVDAEKAPNAEYSGTPCWTALEVWNEPQIITAKADIFSFGLTIWEMCSLEPPHCEVQADENKENTDETINSIDDSVDASVSADVAESYGKRPCIPNIDTDHYGEVLGIFFVCTEENYKKRPSAVHLKSMLEFLSQNQ